MTKDQIIQLAIKEAKAQGIPPAKMLGLIQAESNFNPNAVSPVGAFGVTQFMPKTAKEMGVVKGNDDNAIYSQVSGGARYLKKMLNGLPEEHRNWDNAFRAYNGGLGNLLKEKKGGWQRGKSAMIENLNYPKRIAEYEKNYQQYNEGYTETAQEQPQNVTPDTPKLNQVAENKPIDFNNASNNDFDFLKLDDSTKKIMDSYKEIFNTANNKDNSEMFKDMQKKKYAEESGLYDMIYNKMWG